MRGIPMKTWEIQAALDNRKSAMRRIIKPQPVNVMTEEEQKYRALSGADPYGFCVGTLDADLIREVPWHPGDILYVKEQFYKDAGRYMYKADYSDKEKFYCAGKEVCIRWESSICMPLEAARLFLRVTDLRVERLQDIDCAGAQKEGLRYYDWICQDDSWHPTFADPDSGGDPSEILGFSRLWDKHLPAPDRVLYGWDANPLVRVTEFERISREEAEHR